MTFKSFGYTHFNLKLGVSLWPRFVAGTSNLIYNIAHPHMKKKKKITLFLPIFINSEQQEKQ